MTDSVSNMSDLWEKMRQGDAEAMLELYEYHYNDLLSYGVQMCRSIHTAKDVVNDVFLHLGEQHENLKPVKNVKAYLFACLRRSIFRLPYANNKIIPVNETRLYEEAETSYEDILIAIQQSDEIRMKMQVALDKLTGRQKELIQLKYFQNLSYRQIETATGISTKTAYNTIYNALKVLEAELRGVLFSLLLLSFL